MDGIELVHDSVALIATGEETVLMPPPPADPPRRRRSLRLLLGLGLVASAFLAYYTSVNRAAPAGGGQTSASYAARPAPPAVEPTPAPVAPTPAALPAETPASPETTPAPAPATPAAEPRAAGTNGNKPRPGNGAKKKESKLTSILSKTGRMLKKPFGF